MSKQWGQAAFKQIDVASAATINLSAINEATVRITGTTTIDAITMRPWQRLNMVFADILTLKAGIGTLLGGANDITTGINDRCAFQANGASVVEMLYYQRWLNEIAIGVGSVQCSSAFAVNTTAANAFQAGPAATPAMRVTTQAAGVNGMEIIGNVAGQVVACRAIGETNVGLHFNGRGTGVLAFQSSGAGPVQIGATASTISLFQAPVVQPTTALTAGGATTMGFKASNVANFGVYFGSGAPTFSAAKGSLYLRSDGTGTTDRAYIATSSAGAWAALTTAA